MTALLDGTNAIVDDSGGDIGERVARALAREAARRFRAGRTRGPLEAVADDIT